MCIDIYQFNLNLINKKGLFLLYFSFSAATSGTGPSNNEETSSLENDEDNGFERNLIQSGSGASGTSHHQDDDFISKVAELVSKKLNNPLSKARPVSSSWSNFALSPPSTSIINSADTNPPIHYDVRRFKNDENDSFDEKRLLKLTPTRHKKQAATLLQQFNDRGNELTWNSDGVIFIDQVAIPESDIFILFPYLFKMKHPKTLNGFDDFVKKITDMGLDHLTLKKLRPQNSSKPSKERLSDNWWFLE